MRLLVAVWLLAGAASGASKRESEPSRASIAQLKRGKPSGLYRVSGYVVDFFICPPCPPSAECKPCGSYVVLSESRRKASQDVGPGELRIGIPVTESPQRFPRGRRVELLVELEQSGGSVEVELARLPISVSELRSRPPGSVERVRGTVVMVYTCPPCPKGALCEPCAPDQIILSDRDRLPDNSGLRPSDVDVLTPNPERFKVGQKVELLVRVRDGATAELLEEPQGPRAP